MCLWTVDGRIAIGKLPALAEHGVLTCLQGTCTERPDWGLIGRALGTQLHHSWLDGGKQCVSLLSVCVLCAEVPELYEAEFFEHCVVGGKWLVLTAAVYNRLMYGSPLRPPECRGDLVDLMSVVIPL